MKKVATFLTLFIILILLSTPDSYVKGQQGTVWGPPEGYEIAYVHSVNVKLDGSDLISDNNLPVTDFKIETITSQGYRYQYEGYGDKGFEGVVQFLQMNPSDPFSYFPSGSFPLLVPLVFLGTDNWPTNFAVNLDMNNSRPHGNTVSPFVSTAVSMQNGHLQFQVSGIVTKYNSSRVMSSPQGLPRITHDLLNNDLTNGSFVSTLEYDINTGVLYKFDLHYDTNQYVIQNSNDKHHLVINQKIEFVVIIPPGVIVENIVKLETSLLLFVIFVLLLIRKQRF